MFDISGRRSGAKCLILFRSMIDFFRNVVTDILLACDFGRCVGLILLLSLAGTGFGEAMFLRVVRAAGGKGVKHEYIRVVEAFRENGKTRHRTVLNLGRKDLLAA